MARIKYGNVEKSLQQREQLKAGTHLVKILRCTDRPDKKDLETVFEAVGGKQAGRQALDYIGYEGETREWRFAQFLKALGSSLAGGTFDTAKVIGKQLRITTKDDEYEGEPRARVTRLLALEEGEDEATSAKPVRGRKEAEEEAPEADEGEDEAEDEEVDLDGMDRGELRAFIKSEGLEVRVLKSMSDDDLRAAIAAAMPEDEEESEEESEDEDEEESEEIDLDALDRAGLRKLIKEEGLDIKVLKTMSDDDLRTAIAGAMSEDEEESEDEDEEEESEGENYDEWSLNELRAQLKERGLETTGKKSELIARLREDDSDSSAPF